MKKLIYSLLTGLLAFSSNLFAIQAITVTEKDYFIENKGQWDSEIKFTANLNGLRVHVMTDGILYDYRTFKSEDGKAPRIIGHAVKMAFSGANLFINNEATETLPGKLNYFYGNEPDKWVSNVNRFKRVLINEVYRGIDLALTIDNGQPRYDFICRPYSNPADIRLQFDGAFETSLNKNNEISITTSLGNFIHGDIFAYQTDENLKAEIPCVFTKDNGTFNFQIGDYDKSKNLIIDPLVLLTCMGGSDEDVPNDIAYSSKGAFIVSGLTKSSDFVTTPGAYDRAYKYQEDIFVSRYTIYGVDQTLDFSTYIGGESSDLATSVAVDGNEEVYICGNTISKQFPLVSAFQPEASLSVEGFVVKLNKIGSKLVYSSFLGGNRQDYPTKILVGSDFYAYVCGYTNSSTDFPVVGNVFQKINKGLDDVFLTKISPSGSSLKFSTFIGGTYNERAYAMYLDSEQSVYLTGETNSGDYPVAPFSNSGPNPWDRPYSATLTGSYDCFVTKIKGEGSAIENSTYFGGNADDRGLGIDIDEEYGTIYFAGISAKESGTAKFPITPTSAVSKTNQGGVDCFYAKLDKPKQVTGTGKRQNLLFSTFFGGASNDSLFSMQLDKVTAATYMVGQTFSSKFPVVGENTNKLNGRSDAFLTKFNLAGSEILYSNYFGSSSHDAARAIAVDERGDSYFCGTTDSFDFPLILNKIFSDCNKTSRNGFLGKYVYATINLTSPAGNEIFCPGTMIPVRWNLVGFPNEEIFTVDIGRLSDGNFRVLSNTVTGTAFNWQLATDLPPGKDYVVRLITKSGLYVFNTPTFSILAPPVIKALTASPQKNEYCEGDTITITMSALAGNKKINWYIDNKILLNQSDTILKLDTKVYNKSFSLKVILGGSCNPADTSDIMNFKIIPATKILSQTKDTIIKYGKKLSLNVSCAGQNLSFKWYKDENEIFGEVDSAFAINGVNLSHNGTYKCLIKGDCGEISSADIKVTVDTAGTAVFDDGIQNDDLNFKILRIGNGLELSLFSSENTNCTLKLIDVHGRLIETVYSGLINEGTQSISASINNLNSGTYWMVAETSVNRYSKKFQFVR